MRFEIDEIDARKRAEEEQVAVMQELERQALAAQRDAEKLLVQQIGLVKAAAASMEEAGAEEQAAARVLRGTALGARCQSEGFGDKLVREDIAGSGHTLAKSCKNHLYDICGVI